MAMKKRKGGKYIAPVVREKGWFVKGLLALVLAVASLGLSGWLLQGVLYSNSDPGTKTQQSTTNYAVLDRYDTQMNNIISDALEGVLSIQKTYWLSDADQVAPEPNQDKFGTANSPSELAWLLEEAKTLLDGEELTFNTETPVYPGTKINYYFDDTILVITWKQEIDWVTYTISEVKIAHPSQFRRFLAGGEYGSSVQLTTTEMAASVNAVVASSGDFYKFRMSGIVVYDGLVRKISGKNHDTCFIDEDSNLHLVYSGELTTREASQKYVDENNIRFSLGFGPNLVDKGEIVAPSRYPLGEIGDRYARAGLGQLGKLHYMLVTANSEFSPNTPNIYEFAEVGQQLGMDTFYNLDGGQTAVICMNDKLINKVVYGAQRQISDIIYFATAIPNGG